MDNLKSSKGFIFVILIIIILFIYLYRNKSSFNVGNNSDITVIGDVSDYFRTFNIQILSFSKNLILCAPNDVAPSRMELNRNIDTNRIISFTYGLFPRDSNQLITGTIKNSNILKIINPISDLYATSIARIEILPVNSNNNLPIQLVLGIDKPSISLNILKLSNGAFYLQTVINNIEYGLYNPANSNEVYLKPRGLVNLDVVIDSGFFWKLFFDRTTTIGNITPVVPTAIRLANSFSNNTLFRISPAGRNETIGYYESNLGATTMVKNSLTSPIQLANNMIKPDFRELQLYFGGSEPFVWINLNGYLFRGCTGQVRTNINDPNSIDPNLSFKQSYNRYITISHLSVTTAGNINTESKLYLRIKRFNGGAIGTNPDRNNPDNYFRIKLLQNNNYLISVIRNNKIYYLFTEPDQNGIYFNNVGLREAINNNKYQWNINRDDRGMISNNYNIVPGVNNECYNFFPQKDSPGNDIKKEASLANNINALKDACTSGIVKCVGFNTNGWMKNKISTKTPWITGDNRKGLYVRFDR